MDIFKRASRLKLRVQTNVGELSVEQLWNLNLNQLDVLAVSLQKEYKQSGGKSFLEQKSEKDKLAKLRFDIVLEILNTKVDYQNRALKAQETKAHNQKIDSIIARKQEEELNNLSIEELEGMRA